MMINCYYFKETLLYIFMGFADNSNHLLYFLTTDVVEVFITYVELSYFVSSQITLLFIYYHIFVFLSTGLTVFEYMYFKMLLLGLIFSWGMFIFGINIFVFPASWDFFFRFQNLSSSQILTFYFEVKLNEYLRFYKSIFYLCHFIYQLGILFFIFLDLFKTNLLIVKKFRKLFYFLFLTISTFFTPPEVTYQLIVSICTIIIYELITISMIFKIELIRITSAIN
jgi:Sec-independent protein secretion pathway component TatC